MVVRDYSFCHGKIPVFHGRDVMKMHEISGFGKMSDVHRARVDTASKDAAK